MQLPKKTQHHEINRSTNNLKLNKKKIATPIFTPFSLIKKKKN